MRAPPRETPPRPEALLRLSPRMRALYAAVALSTVVYTAASWLAPIGAIRWFAMASAAFAMLALTPRLLARWRLTEDALVPPWPARVLPLRPGARVVDGWLINGDGRPILHTSMIHPDDWRHVTARFGPGGFVAPRRWPRIRPVPILVLMMCVVAGFGLVLRLPGAPPSIAGSWVVIAALSIVGVGAVRRLRSADFDGQREGRLLLAWTALAATPVATDWCLYAAGR